MEAKDPPTQRHSERVAKLAERLARVLGWSEESAGTLHEAALVHDVGKIGVAGELLGKDGPLTAPEDELMRAHPALGAQIAAGALSEEQIDWVRHHHERIDGRGYPDGLAGADVSEGARVLALADAWDRLTSADPLRAPLGRDRALAEVRAEAGSRFCPRVVGALEAALEDAGARARPHGAPIGQSPGESPAS